MRRNKRLSEVVVAEEPIKIDRITPTGQGIGTIKTGEKAGMKVFFWNALPGEEILEYKVIKRTAHFEEAIAEKIQNENPARITPKDEQFLSTSPWQIMTDEYEAELKTSIIKELYRNLVNTDINFHQSAKTYFYRNKMEYALYYDLAEEKIKLAVHARGSHQKIPIKTSSLELPAIWQKANEIVDELNAKHEEARKYQSLLLRANQDGEVSGGLFENGKPHPAFKKLEDTLLGQKYSYSANGFFQINLPVYEDALKRIKEIVDSSSVEKVVDLYSGVGTIGLTVAREKDLTLVEVDKSAYMELVENTKDLPNTTPVLAKSEEVLDYITPDSVVILDPPRAGCDNKLIERLIEVKPKKIVYLSCNPITQVRDVEKLVENGAKIDSLEAFNFFPHTPHIESLISISF